MSLFQNSAKRILEIKCKDVFTLKTPHVSTMISLNNVPL